MKEEFTYIYDNEKWGKNKGSGEGSRPKFNQEYIPFLEDFLKTNNIKSVIDFGCGDWQFSRYIDWGDKPFSTMPKIDYLGLDVVDSVIDNNTGLQTSHILIEILPVPMSPCFFPLAIKPEDADVSVILN